MILLSQKAKLFLPWQNRKPESYKITKKQVNYALKKQKENEQITMEELVKIVKKKYNDLDITSQHLGQILRDINITRKRTRHERWIKNLRFLFILLLIK